MQRCDGGVGSNKGSQAEMRSWAQKYRRIRTATRHTWFHNPTLGPGALFSQKGGVPNTSSLENWESLIGLRWKDIVRHNISFPIPAARGQLGYCLRVGR